MKNIVLNCQSYSKSKYMYIKLIFKSWKFQAYINSTKTYFKSYIIPNKCNMHVFRKNEVSIVF